MNAIATAILYTMSLANNGYSGKLSTIVNVVRETKAPIPEVRNVMDELEREGRIVNLGNFDRQSYYCLAEQADRVKACMFNFS